MDEISGAPYVSSLLLYSVCFYVLIMHVRIIVCTGSIVYSFLPAHLKLFS
jgi:hypothetical protein